MVTASARDGECGGEADGWAPKAPARAASRAGGRTRREGHRDLPEFGVAAGPLGRNELQKKACSPQNKTGRISPGDASSGENIRGNLTPGASSSSMKPG